MNSTLRPGILEEIACGPCFSYVLEASDLFQLTEYKVMQSQTDGLFVNCIKMTFNGNAMLFYMSKNLKSFDTLARGIDTESLLRITENLIDSVIRVQENGFLSCDSLVLEQSKIFVDRASWKVSLVYLPITKRTFGNFDSFEAKFRPWLAEILNQYEDDKIKSIVERLENPMLTLGEICGSKPVQADAAPKRQVVLRGVNLPRKTEIVIRKNSFVIGRHPDMADEALGFSNALGRKHCRIDLKQDKCFLTDLESKNHTYVNRKCLPPNTPVEIHDGDRIRMADLDFQVEIR